MKKRYLYLILLFSVILITSCKKEYSYENGSITSQGSLQDDGTGNCLPKTVNGIYISGTALGASNSISVSLNVTKAGTYSIYTDTVNGYYFRASGVFTTLGNNQVTFKAAGNPIASETDLFLITYDSTACSIPVTVLPIGTSSAIGTLSGGPGACTPFIVNGTYVDSTLITASDTVQVQINVTTAGVYNISTNTVNGFSFSASGTAVTGTQTITLIGSGSPITTGNTTFTVSFGSSSCSFVVNVIPVDYFPRTINSNWSYEFNGLASDSLLVNVIPNTLPALGNTYNIFMQNNGTVVDTSGYYRKSGSNYYTYTDLSYYLGLDSSQWVEFIFLKDNQPASTIWYTSGYSGTIGGNPITVRIKYTVLQKDVPVSITTSAGTIIYPNTIIMQEQYEAYNGTSWISLDNYTGYYKDYYSRNIGWILDEYYDTSGTLAGDMALRRSVVY